MCVLILALRPGGEELDFAPLPARPAQGVSEDDDLTNGSHLSAAARCAASLPQGPAAQRARHRPRSWGHSCGPEGGQWVPRVPPGESPGDAAAGFL